MGTEATTTADPLLWSPKQAAAHLGISTRQLARWERDGVLPSECVHRPGGTRVKYRVAELRAWAAGR